MAAGLAAEASGLPAQHCPITALHPCAPPSGAPQAQLGARQWAAAVAACRAGEALVPLDSEGRCEFTPLLDTAAVHAARAGSLAGYDGAQLEVRDVGNLDGP